MQVGAMVTGTLSPKKHSPNLKKFIPRYYKKYYSVLTVLIKPSAGAYVRALSQAIPDSKELTGTTPLPSHSPDSPYPKIEKEINN